MRGPQEACRSSRKDNANREDLPQLRHGGEWTPHSIHFFRFFFGLIIINIFLILFVLIVLLS